MSNDYLNPFDSNNYQNLNSVSSGASRGNYAANYRKISKELDEDKVEIQGKNPKTSISFGKNIQKATQDSVQFLEKKTSSLADGVKKKFEELSAIIRKTSLTSEEVRLDLRKFLTSKKISKARELTEEQISAILQKASKDNISFIKKLCLNKDLDTVDLERIVSSLNEHNFSFAKKLYFDKKFYSDQISDVLFTATSKENVEAKSAMYDFLKWKRPVLYSASDILASVDENNLEAKIRMYNFFKGKVNMQDVETSGILISVDEKNIEAKLEAYKYFKSEKSLPEDEALFITNYIQNFDAKTKDVIEAIFGTENISREYLIEEIFGDKELSSLRLEVYDLLKGIGGYSNSQIMEILMQVHKNNIGFAKIICEDMSLPTESKGCLLRVADKIGQDEISRLMNSPKTRALLSDSNLVSRNNYLFMTKLSDLDLDNIDKLFAEVEILRSSALKNPQLYVNGEFKNLSEAQSAVDSFFAKNKVAFAKMLTVMDKEAINNLLRMRLEDAGTYIRKFSTFNIEEMDLLKSLANACTVDSKPLMPTQKIQLIDLLLGYKQNQVDTSKIIEMAQAGRVDIGKLNLDLLHALLKKCGLTDEEIAGIPKEKLMKWDVSNIHLLANEIRSAEDSTFADVLRASNLEDFKAYILDIANAYGQTNAQTRVKFNKYGMNYNAWLNPEGIETVQFVIRDKNEESLKQIAGKVIQDIEALRKTPAKGFIDKQFAQFIVGDKFVIPEEIMGNKTKLNELVQNILNKLDSVFKRAQGNIDNPVKATSAQNTLTIKDHLKQRLLDISGIQVTKSTRTYDLTIKMWDRTPQRDIFQGNYSTCCIGMGGGNGDSMPHYLLNTAFNMIELVDNKTGDTIGNALCYFVVDANGKPAFMIDNIEIKNSQIPSKEAGKELRDAIVQYAKNVVQQITGSSSTNIYMSESYNDVPHEDLSKVTRNIQLLGETQCDSVYMDAYGGWVKKDEYKGKKTLLKL